MNPLREMVDRHPPLRHPIGWVIDGANRTDSSRLDPVTAGQAETANDLGKAELVDWEGPWKGADDLEFAMLDWFNHTRLRSALS